MEHFLASEMLPTQKVPYGLRMRLGNNQYSTLETYYNYIQLQSLKELATRKCLTPNFPCLFDHFFSFCDTYYYTSFICGKWSNNIQMSCKRSHESRAEKNKRLTQSGRSGSRAQQAGQDTP